MKIELIKKESGATSKDTNYKTKYYKERILND
jgi:hypothetical protein